MASIYRADLIYSPFDIGPIYSFRISVILAIRNPNYILPTDLVTLKYPNLHKFFSYLSSITAKKLLFPSNYAMHNIGPHLFSYNKKSDVIYHGIDLSGWVSNENSLDIEFNELMSKPNILCCSPFYRFKKIDTLIRALHLINSKRVNEPYNLLLIGKFVSPDYKQYILNLIKDLNCKSNVYIFSDLTRSRVVEFYLNCELIVIPSLYETFGHMYLEALASKKPTIVYKSEIAEELLKESVTYFSNSCPQEIADIIIQKKYLDDFDKKKIKAIEILNELTSEKENIDMVEYLVSNCK